MSCCRYLIAGRVQGVWYRASTEKKARSLGLRGYARNLDDGRVEVEACGEAAQLQRLLEWLWQGPDGARVEAIDSVSLPEGSDTHTNFTIVY